MKVASCGVYGTFLCAPATYDVNTSAKLSSSFTTSASVKLLINSLAIHFYSLFNDIFKHPVVTLCPTGRQNLWPVKLLVFRISLAWAKRKICRQIGLHAGPGQACVDVCFGSGVLFHELLTIYCPFVVLEHHLRPNCCLCEMMTCILRVCESDICQRTRLAPNVRVKNCFVPERLTYMHPSDKKNRL